tara:strand:+ start:1359 stop:2186 length:828 start_codon:yes stop_codon:yes gene_type:complete
MRKKMKNENVKLSRNPINSNFPVELIYNVGTLIFSIIFVHTIYLTLIRPRAQALITIAEQKGVSVERVFSVIMKDPEQELCIILMFWAIFMIGSKIYSIIKQNYIINVDILGFDNSGKVTKDQAIDALQDIERYKFGLGDSVIIQTLSSSLRSYITTSNIQNASETLVTATENNGMRLEADLSMIRYIVWAIPSIGFIGTVRGIGQALSKADIALAGDISAMTSSLGVAFNSTFVALLISILLMFLLHQIQRMNDKLVLDAHDYCNKYFISKVLE